MNSVLDVRAIDGGMNPVTPTYAPQVSIPAVWAPRTASDRKRSKADVRESIRHGGNVVLALLLLILTLPLMVGIAILIRLTSPGPIFYVQTRVGIDRRRGTPRPEFWERRLVDYGGRLFRIYKFRTMVWNVEETVQRWAKRGDPRITAVGRVLRKYRLDELPQLFNVLKGDMNLVGPRPEQPQLFVALREQIADYAARQRVLPGITGLAQINHGYDGCLDDVCTKVRYDLEYIAHASLLRDIKILVQTIPVVVFQRGAI